MCSRRVVGVGGLFRCFVVVVVLRSFRVFLALLARIASIDCAAVVTAFRRRGGVRIVLSGRLAREVTPVDARQSRQ